MMPVMLALTVLLFICGDVNSVSYRDTDKANYTVTLQRVTGGRSTVLIQARTDNSVDFRRTFSAYVVGFGHPNGNFWLGLRNIFYLTNTGYSVLTVTMKSWNGEVIQVKYRKFRLLNDADYRLEIDGYEGPGVLDDLSHNNNMIFATLDYPDKNGCAAEMKAGWWYNYCTSALPNGIYYTHGWYTPSGDFYDGIFWNSWKGYRYSLKSIRMDLSRI